MGVAAVAIAVHNVYTLGLEVHVAGVRFRSMGLARPVFVTALAWLGSRRLVTRHPPSRNALVLWACLFAYSLSPHFQRLGDVIPSEYTALSIATGQGTSLDPYPELLDAGMPYFMTRTPEGLRSSYPIGPALLAWPLYVPAPLSAMPRAALADRVGRVAAAFIGLACVALVLGIARRLNPPVPPWLLALAYGLGTSHWPTASTALWQHGPGEVWLLGALDRLLDEDTPPTRRLLALGACLTLGAFTRPPLVPSLILVAFLAWRRHGWRFLVTAAAALAVALPLAFDALVSYGSVLGGYATQTAGFAPRPLAPWLDSVVLLLASPSRGVLWYEPVVIATLALALIHARRRCDALLLCALAGIAVTLALYGQWPVFWGGHCFGPRLLTDALPWWIVVVASAGRERAGLRQIIVSTTMVGAFIGYLGTHPLAIWWDNHPSVDRFPERLRSWRDSQLLYNVLAALPGEEHLRRAVEVQVQGDTVLSRDLWIEEWRRRPWHDFAGHQVADLLLRTDRLRDALRASETIDTRYARHLTAHLGAILALLQDPRWLPAAGATASRDPGDVDSARDGKLSTWWSSKSAQVPGDWLELTPDTPRDIAGVALVSAPAFGQEPRGLRVTGRTGDGRDVDLIETSLVDTEWTGLVVLPFAPKRLASLRLTATIPWRHAWSVAEARLLTEPESRLTGSAPMP